MSLHHYQGIPLGNVWLENGFTIHQTKWGAGTSYSDLSGLFRTITLELCISNNQLTGEALRFLRTRLEMTQDQLGQELGCTGQAIAKWEKGEVVSIPVAPARLLRLLVLSRFAPEIKLVEALVSYNEQPKEKIVFTYSEVHGWQSKQHATSSVGTHLNSESRNRVAEFMRAFARIVASPSDAEELGKLAPDIKIEMKASHTQTIRLEGGKRSFDSAEAMRKAFDKYTETHSDRGSKTQVCSPSLQGKIYQNAA